MPSDISFDTNSFALKPELRRVLDPFAASLAGDPSSQVSIVGYTDSTGVGRDQPAPLGRARGERARLPGRRGVSPTRIETTGRGERDPVADNSTEAGRARNRRVEIYLREPAA